MSRFRLPLLILGLVGALVVAVAVFAVIRIGRGTPVQLPVAIEDIPPRTPLDPSLFRLQEVRGFDPSTLDAYVTADRFGEVMGHQTLEVIHAGSPVLWAQVDPERQTRLTLALSDPTHLVYPLPVTADQVGNFLVSGDRVDIIFTLGRVAQQELVHVEEWTVDGPSIPGISGTTTPTVRLEEPAPRPGDMIVVTTTLHLPVAKVILPNVPVLRVEREQVRPPSATYGLSGEEARPRTVEGEIIRLYLEVDREQAEVLSFALHNGALNLPARAVPADGASEGFTWEDFQTLFFQGRPEKELRGER